MRLIVALLVIVAGIAWVARQGVVVVKPHQAMIVSQGDRIIGVRSPGLNWYWPFLQNAALIDVTSIRRQDIKADLELSDTSKCPIRVGLIYRIEDPIRAFTWRRANGLDVSKVAPTFGRNDYREAGRAFVAALRDAGKKMTPSEANAGAIETWIKGYRPSTHKDGARTVDVQIDTIGCSQALAATQKEAKRKRNRKTIKGPVQALSRHLSRESVPVDTKVHVWTLRPSKLILRDGAQAQFSELQVRAMITDRQKFEAAFGPHENGTRIAEVRTMAYLESAMRSIAGTLSETDLRNFDPFAIVGDGQSTRQRLEQLGIIVVDIGGQNPSYQMVTYKYD